MKTKGREAEIVLHHSMVTCPTGRSCLLILAPSVLFTPKILLDHVNIYCNMHKARYKLLNF